MLVEKQEWFVRLIAQGVGPSEACRIVGINRRTGVNGQLVLPEDGQLFSPFAVSWDSPTAAI
jgi:hypothetical protein